MTSEIKFTRPAFNVDETGKALRHGIEVEIVFDPTLNHFTIWLPGFMRDRMAHVGFVSAESIAEVVSTYEAVAEQYQREVLATKTVKKLGLLVNYHAAYQHSVGFQMAELLEADGVLCGGEDRDDYHAIIDDTPEHRAKIAAIQASIGVARDMLNKMVDEGDAAVNLMALDLSGKDKVIEFLQAGIQAMNDMESKAPVVTPVPEGATVAMVGDKVTITPASGAVIGIDAEDGDDL